MSDIVNIERAANLPVASTTASALNMVNPGTLSVAALPREYLSFRLGAEDYGIDILKVQEIRGYGEPTHIANAPPFIKGVVNLRGVIVPIIDLRIKFGLSEVRYNDITVTIVLNVGNRVFGVVVDSVSDVIALNPNEIKPAPSFSAAINTEHIIGIGAIKNGDVERMLILVDIERLMASSEMGLIAEATH